MNQTSNKETCERGSELISVLYGEASEREAIDFQRHMQGCGTCQAEFASLGQLRESIDAWKLEALSGFPSPQVATSRQIRRSKSAFAALREFFDLSPLWLRGATAFATVLFIFFAVLAFAWFRTEQPAITNAPRDAKYSEQEKNAIVQKALDEQKASLLASLQPKSEEPTRAQSVNRPQRSGNGPTQMVKGRRPLSRWEREQLAADLRLLQQSDDDGLELLSDRINQ